MGFDEATKITRHKIQERDRVAENQQQERHQKNKE